MFRAFFVSNITFFVYVKTLVRFNISGDYYKEKNGCNGPNCRPCVYGVDYPECGGLPDGAYVIPELKNSPFYAVCDSGRGLKHECPFDANGMRMIFDGEQKKCVQA